MSEITCLRNPQTKWLILTQRTCILCQLKGFRLRSHISAWDREIMAKLNIIREAHKGYISKPVVLKHISWDHINYASLQWALKQVADLLYTQSVSLGHSSPPPCTPRIRQYWLGSSECTQTRDTTFSSQLNEHNNTNFTRNAATLLLFTVSDIQFSCSVLVCLARLQTSLTQVLHSQTAKFCQLHTVCIRVRDRMSSGKGSSQCAKRESEQFSAVNIREEQV